jgi:hypothetical protein
MIDSYHIACYIGVSDLLTSHKESFMKRTRSYWILSAILFVVLRALPAVAADVTGTWTSQVKTNDGNELLITFVFRQEGAKLTGTVSTPRETANMSDGKVDGKKIFFTAVFPNANFTYEGTIAGDQIKVAAKVPDFPTSDLTLKRAEKP